MSTKLVYENIFESIEGDTEVARRLKQVSEAMVALDCALSAAGVEQQEVWDGFRLLREQAFAAVRSGASA